MSSWRYQSTLRKRSSFEFRLRRPWEAITGRVLQSNSKGVGHTHQGAAKEYRQGRSGWGWVLRPLVTIRIHIHPPISSSLPVPTHDTTISCFGTMSCGALHSQPAYLGLRVGSIFVTMASSSFGALFPVITKQSTLLPIPKRVYE